MTKNREKLDSTINGLEELQAENTRDNICSEWMAQNMMAML